MIPSLSSGSNFFSFQVEEYIYPTDSIPEYSSILVPNVDNTRTDFLLETIAKQGKVSCLRCLYSMLFDFHVLIELLGC